MWFQCDWTFIGDAPDVSIILRLAHLDLSCSGSMAISTKTEVTDLRHGPFITSPRRHLQHADKCEAEKGMKSRRKGGEGEMNSEEKGDDKRRWQHTEETQPSPLVLHKRQMRRTDETECKAVSGRSVHRRSSSFVLHRDVEEREEIRRGWMVVGHHRWRMNRRVVGNVKVDFHLARSFARKQLKQRTCRPLSDRCFSWMCWIWNDGLQERLRSCFLQEGILPLVQKGETSEWLQH